MEADYLNWERLNHLCLPELSLAHRPDWATRMGAVGLVQEIGPAKSIDIEGGLLYKRPRSYLLPQLYSHTGS